MAAWLRVWTDRRGPAMAGWLAMVSVLLVPLGLAAARSDPPPELRIIAAGQSLASLIVDRDARLLVIASNDRAEARAALGRLTRPWETDITTLVAPASDTAAPGLLEALARTAPGQVIVLGVPGAQPVWRELELECARRGIELTYVAGESQITTQRLSMLLSGPLPGAKTPTSLALRRGGVGVLIAVDGGAVAERGQLLVSNGIAAAANGVAAQITSTALAGAVSRVVVGDISPVRVVIEPDKLRIAGGAAISPLATQTPTTDSGKQGP